MGAWAPIHPVNSEYTDLFSIFEIDGITKKSGETSFDVQLIVDSAVSAVPVTITEIATSPGDYEVKFTPDSQGSWFLEILVNYSNEIYSVNLKVVNSGGILIV